MSFVMLIWLDVLRGRDNEFEAGDNGLARITNNTIQQSKTKDINGPTSESNVGFTNLQIDLNDFASGTYVV